MVEQKLHEYITGTLVPEDSKVPIERDTDLLRDAGVDSTALMQLVLWIEDTFAFDVPVEDLVPENFGSIRAMTEFIERHRANSPPNGATNPTDSRVAAE